MINNLKGKHILMVVENLPVPFDRRVWQEANTLKGQGAEISIICPQMYWEGGTAAPSAWKPQEHRMPCP